MSQIEGIKYRTNANGHRIVSIDLNLYGDNPLLEDFLDGLEVLNSSDEPARPLREYIEEKNKRRRVNV